MAITASESNIEPRAFSLGPVTVQLMSYSAVSGATSGTVTASRLKNIYHIMSDGYLLKTAAPTFSGNVATLAFTVPASVTAFRSIGGVTYTAVTTGVGGNSITVEYVAGGTAGAEVVTVVGNAISVQIEDGVSSITQVRTAVNLEPLAAALVTATGTSATAVVAAAPVALTSGFTGGARGLLICFGK